MNKKISGLFPVGMYPYLPVHIYDFHNNRSFVRSYTVTMCLYSAYCDTDVILFLREMDREKRKLQTVS
jgi:hypothetical protein